MTRPSHVKDNVGVTDIMKIFHLSYPNAKKVFRAAKMSQRERVVDRYDRVSIEEVLKVQGINNMFFWLEQQKELAQYKNV